MGNAAHDEYVFQVIEFVQVLQDQAELPHQLWVFEVLAEGRVEFGDKAGVTGGSVAMKAGSMVNSFSGGWHVPQVLPFPR